MSKFLRKTFSVAVGSKDYRDGWERIFAKKKCPRCGEDGKEVHPCPHNSETLCTCCQLLRRVRGRHLMKQSWTWGCVDDCKGLPGEKGYVTEAAALRAQQRHFKTRHPDQDMTAYEGAWQFRPSNKCPSCGRTQ